MRKSPFQEGKIAESELQKGAEAEGNLKNLWQEIKEKYQGDVLNIPEQEIPHFQEIAEQYQKNAAGKDHILDKLATDLLALPKPEQKSETEE